MEPKKSPKLEIYKFLGHSLPAPQKMLVFVLQTPNLHCLPLEQVVRPRPKNKASDNPESKATANKMAKS